MPKDTTGNGPYAMGGFVGKGKRHQGEHRRDSAVTKAVKAVKKATGKGKGK